MSDAADSDVSEIDGINKRKRTTPSPQKARKQRASQNRADPSSTEAQSPSEHIAVKRRTRKQSLKAREAQKSQEELDEHSHDTQRERGDQDQDIMSVLREMNRNTAEMNKRMAQMEKSNAEKEEAYKEQIARLEEVVQAIALRDPSKDLIGNGSRMTMDLKLLHEEDTAELDTPPKIRDRLEKGLQSIKGLQDLKLKDFKMWHTNDSVEIIRFVVSKEEEKLIPTGCTPYASTNKMREDAGQIFREENGVKVHIKVDTKEEAERLLVSKEVTFGKCTVTVKPFLDINWGVFANYTKILQPLREAERGLKLEKAKERVAEATVENYPNREALEDHYSTDLDRGWKKLQKYFEKLDDAPAYYAAIILHPHLKSVLCANAWKDRPDWIINSNAAFQKLWQTYKGRSVALPQPYVTRRIRPHSDPSNYTLFLTGTEHQPGNGAPEEAEDEYERWKVTEPVL
ncbi:hypothetical protein B0A49_04300 [Cryomyces minteri]|uniref:Uncharacterized protein n=1 Tax=Cryomyces minteri TaxID=331657 RepID=A0A4V5NJM8_9PEZI|nr:hypothetical protein B0A49_04300 [Cryomyces minteri]